MLSVKGTEDLGGSVISPVVKDGRWVVAQTDRQTAAAVVMSHKGDFYHRPLWGAGISDMAGDELRAEWKKRVRDALRSAGFAVRYLSIENGKVEIELA